MWGTLTASDKKGVGHKKGQNGIGLFSDCNYGLAE